MPLQMVAACSRPRIPEYHSTDTDRNRLSKTQSQRRTKAACSQKILKLRLGKAEKEAQEKEDAREEPGTKNGNNSRNRGLSIQRDS